MRTISLAFAVLSLFLVSFVNASDRVELAISGYDVVSYFTEKKPVQGESRFQTEWNGRVWHFSSQHNLALFKEEPERYEPRFDGHCANGLSDGHLVTANPKIYRIIDGQLYLFFSWWGKAQWAVDQQEQIELAEYWWSEFNEGATTH
ncbi:YHS domain-containing (seleno)protein [Reinekea marinisedimentorum]|uniref:YHS domain-containing protein n=1 Tax=Reinekea marinisedimentorum TaxID=230495 RepID=A0A4R3IBT8_9GAMM|nr:YHS domain-containing (seleno)protein [Reinekea marinisedimentorum]TCS43075.1 YHS domain-containing protein [Reinekea marinisedimentorum]